MKHVQEDLQKLTNASARRDPPKGGWKDKITFPGKCFNCGIKGHKAEDCDKKAQRRMVNAIATGNKEAKDRFSSSEAYINCLHGGIEENDATACSRRRWQ